MSDTIKRDYFIGEPEGFPEVSNGQVLYDSNGNNLYIDYDNARKLVNPKQYWNVLDGSEIWETIINNDNYATDYLIGDIFYLDMGTAGIHPMELIAINTDDKADGTGKARMTWISKDIITFGLVDFDGNEWPESWLRGNLNEELFNELPKCLRDNIVEVNKTYGTQNHNIDVGFGNMTTKTSQDKIWIPSVREIFDQDYYSNYLNTTITRESSGESYCYNLNQTERMKVCSQEEFKLNDQYWWLRSHVLVDGSMHYYYCVTNKGDLGYMQCGRDAGLVIGFCI